jgi:hypothetical protein
VTASIRNLTIERGADFLMDFPLPVGLDPVGLQAAMEIRAAYGFPAPILTLTTSNDGLEIINTQSVRAVRARVPAAVTSALLPGANVYDIRAKAATGTVSRIWQGVASISERVTEYDFPPFLRHRGGGYLKQRAGNGRILLRV